MNYMSIILGERDRGEKEVRDKEPRDKEKKRHRRLSIKRRVRKSSEGFVRQQQTPMEIDWTKCVIYSSTDHIKINKITESELKIENIIGRHRHGMVRR